MSQSSPAFEGERDHAQAKTRRRADHRQAPRGGGPALAGQDGRAGGQADRRHGGDYYRWRKEYGGLKVDQAKRLKELEGENARLKRLLAEAELDKAILKEAASGKY